MNIFEFEDYRSYIKKRLKIAPKKGHGQALKIAKALEISTALVSQILSGQRQMSLEQGSLLCEYFGFDPAETEYFLLLVQLERAGNPSLRKVLSRQMDRAKESSKKKMDCANIAKIISDEEKITFYSEWYYYAVRQATTIPGLNTAEAIAAYLNIPTKAANEALNFLIQAGLCLEENEKASIGPNKAHIDSDSLFAKMHHSNWRHKALERIKHPHPEKLHYSSPFTLSKKDCDKVRKKMLIAIEEVEKIVDPSSSEELMCLNIDWFKVRPD